MSYVPHEDDWELVWKRRHTVALALIVAAVVVLIASGNWHGVGFA